MRGFIILIARISMHAELIKAPLESGGGRILDLVSAVGGNDEVRDTDPLRKVGRAFHGVIGPCLAVKSNLKLTGDVSETGDHRRAGDNAEGGFRAERPTGKRGVNRLDAPIVCTGRKARDNVGKSRLRISELWQPTEAVGRSSFGRQNVGSTGNCADAQIIAQAIVGSLRIARGIPRE